MQGDTPIYIQGDTGGYADTGGYGLAGSPGPKPPPPPPTPPRPRVCGPLLSEPAARTHLTQALAALVAAQAHTRESKWAPDAHELEQAAWLQLERCNQELALTLHGR